LVRACASGSDRSARQAFVAHFQPVIRATVIKTGRRFTEMPSDLIDDLVQDTYVRIFDQKCKILRSFEARHEASIFAFIQAVSFSVVQDHFRYASAQKRGGKSTTLPIQEMNDLAGLENPASRYEATALLEVIDHILTEICSADTLVRDRSIFWLYHLQDYTAKEIAGLPSVPLSVKGVESVVFRVTGEVRRRLQQMSISERLAQKSKGTKA
jgi:RNA polymerase sigma factor (sigma-70 family)